MPGRLLYNGGMDIDIFFDPRPLEAFRVNGNERTILAATTRAASKSGGDAIRKVRIESSRIIREKKRIKVKIVNRGLPTARYGSVRSLASLKWVMKVSGAPIPLAAYPARQTKKGLSVEINRGKRVLIKSAFLATMGSAKAAFMRKGKARLPVRKLLTTRLSDAFADADVEPRITTFARNTFEASYMRLLPMELAKL